jgi:hypothetical protein
MYMLRKGIQAGSCSENKTGQSFENTFDFSKGGCLCKDLKVGKEVADPYASETPEGITVYIPPGMKAMHPFLQSFQIFGMQSRNAPDGVEFHRIVPTVVQKGSKRRGRGIQEKHEFFVPKELPVISGTEGGQKEGNVRFQQNDRCIWKASKESLQFVAEPKVKKDRQIGGCRKTGINYSLRLPDRVSPGTEKTAVEDQSGFPCICRNNSGFRMGSIPACNLFAEIWP